MSKSIDPATYDFYTERAPSYTDKFAIRHSRHLDPFLDRLAPGAKVLEIGCGGGQDSAHIRQRDFAIDATDGTPAMVEAANTRFALNARVMAFDDLNASDTYDAIWAQACLLHCPREHLPSVLGSIHDALRGSGWHFASYKLGEGEARDKFGRINNLPTENWIKDAYRNAGFAIVEAEVYAGKGYDGTQRDWIALTVQKQ